MNSFVATKADDSQVQMERPTPTVGIAELRRRLAALSSGLLSELDKLLPVETGIQPVALSRPTAKDVRAILRSRRMREKVISAELFADPAWDMLLDLTAARLEGRDISTSSLCIASAVPPTTALRWVGNLEDEGAITRLPDRYDGRRIVIRITDDCFEKIMSLLQESRMLCI